MTLCGRGILIEGLTKRLGGVVAVDGLSLAVPPSSISCLVGPNGAGKTTALEILVGLRAPTSGDAWIDGVSVRSERIHRIRRSLGYVPQRPILYEDLTAREHLHFMSELYGGGAGGPHTIDRELEQWNLIDVANAPLRTFSSGMKARVAILVATLHEPRTLVLDEPFGSLDAESMGRLDQTLLRCRDRGGSVLLSTHRLDVVRRLADQVAVLDHGRLRFGGTVAEWNVAAGVRGNGRPISAGGVGASTVFGPDR